MSTRSITNGMFLGNLSFLLESEDLKTKDILDSLRHLDNCLLIINEITTIKGDTYLARILPLEFDDDAHIHEE